MNRASRRSLYTSALLALTLLVVVTVFPMVLGPAGLFAAWIPWIVGGMVAFVLLQLFLFRLLGLSSQADDESPADSRGDGEDADAAPDDGGDWRAWRG